MANENFTQFADGGVLQATDYMVGYRGGAETKILGSNILAYIESNALALVNGSTAHTQSPGDNSTKVATTAFVAAASGGVTSITGTSGQVVASASTGAVTLSLAAALTGINSITSATGQPLTLAALDTGQNIVLNPAYAPAGTGGSVVINTSAYDAAYPSMLVTGSIGSSHSILYKVLNNDSGGQSAFLAANSDGTLLYLTCNGSTSGGTCNIACNASNFAIYIGSGFHQTALFSVSGIAIGGTISTAAAVTYDFGAASNVAAAGLTALNLTKQLLHIVGGVNYYIPCATSAQ